MLSLDSFESFVSILALCLPDPPELLGSGMFILVPGPLLPEPAVLLDQLVQHAFQLVASSSTLCDLLADLSYLTLSVGYSCLLFLNLIIEVLIVARVCIDNSLLISQLLLQIIYHLLISFRFLLVSVLHLHSLIHSFSECIFKFLQLLPLLHVELLPLSEFREFGLQAGSQDGTFLGRHMQEVLHVLREGGLQGRRGDVSTRDGVQRHFLMNKI